MLKVSVIIPIYNVEKYLKDCLDSVINQSLKEIEIICVDDCSTDQSLGILNRYAEADSRIKIVNNQKNHGQSYSRNRGLEVSKGEYVYFLDSDDMITLEAMEDLYTIAKTGHLDAVFFDAQLLFENENLQKKFVNYSSERLLDYSGFSTGEELFVNFIQNKEWTASPPRQFWRRSFLKENKLKFFEGIIHEDELFSFLALLKAKRVAVRNNKYFIRRFRENSTMTVAISKKNLEGIFICYSEILAYWQSVNLCDQTNQAIETYITGLYKKAKLIYRSLSETIESLEQGNLFTRHLFKVLITDSYGKICSHIETHKIEMIKRYEHVIIYGAGTVAREVLEILDKNEIRVHCFAVSDVENNPKYIMGLPVYAIEDLIEYRDKALVLIGVTSKHQKDIHAGLEKFKFKNTMFIL